MSARNSFPFAFALLLGLTLAACQGEAPEDTASSGAEASEPAEANEQSAADATESEQAQTGNEGTTMHRGNPDRMNLEEAIEAARQELAGRSGVEAEQLVIVEARATTWPNGALGCPEEGMMYTQALVDGFYIVLSDGEEEYAYHAGRNGKPFFCPAERSQAPSSSSDDGALS